MTDNFVELATWVAAHPESPWMAVVRTPRGVYAVQSNTPIPVGVGLPELAAELARRLLGALRPGAAGPDQLLDADAMAAKLGTTPDWLRRHCDDLPFTVHVSSGQLRFSERGAERWIASRMGKKP